MRIARLRALTQFTLWNGVFKVICRNEDCPTEGTRINMKTKKQHLFYKAKGCFFFLRRNRWESTDKIKRYL